MPHSLYLKTVYPPIRNVDEYRQDLARYRAKWEDGEVDMERDEMLLDIGESLVEHFDFLETKLNIKVPTHLLMELCNKREYDQLAKQNDTLERENETLKKENKASKEESQAQKLEIAALKERAGEEGRRKGNRGAAWL
ncbi:hypothetical protein EPUS_05445 [Endocarpon pusillum Z07020]|uniref:Uncharacterized protein n=1 Tax=Endocarpon pusillum (strain Z07020 / HMAS-L-300199) TaxID=1263415 RepID=U1GDV3_ENDPU|nr:uncharacterized protein EPUS_05445 [Endocarpon pusillum Z07020]ERF69901.1 hypothetical protein EPUS_05445 [Endocarpon pusillum Z07020]